MSLFTIFPILVALSGCNGGSSEDAPEAPAGPAPATDRPSLVLVTLDTTRADRIGVYGYKGAHTPNLDALAAGGIRFARAYATVPLTTPTHSSILTGLYPTRHGVHTNGDAILPDQARTLAEVLSDEGYDTAASVAAFVTTRVWNLDQGFDSYYDAVKGDKVNPANRWMRERPAGEVVDDALAWLEQRENPEKPFFMWVHFYDPHRPYEAPDEWVEELTGRPYDAEVAYMDDQFGRLYDTVETRGGPGGVGWIAVADHGEALRGEHGEVDHGLFVFDTTMHVPFIVQPPEPLAEGRPIRDVAVSNVDVMPTALGMLGVEVPDDLDGRDLSAALSQETIERDPVYLESFTAMQRFGYHPELAMAEKRFKYIATPSGRLVNPVRDPKEEDDFSESQPELVARLKADLEKIEAAAVADAGGAVAPEVAEQLAALGYMTVGSSGEAVRSDIDAKDRLSTIRSIEEARALARAEGKSDAALARYKEIIEAEPQITEARLGLARLHLARHEPAEAEEVLRAALDLEPTSAVMRLNLASALAMQMRFEESQAEADHVLDLVPTDTGARVTVMRMLGAQGKPEEALERAREWLDEGALEPAVQAEVGIMLARMGDLTQARRFLEGSLADDVPRPFVHLMLAREASSRGDKEGTMALLREELGAFPQQREARWVLGNMLMETSRWDEAAAEYAYLAESSDEDFQSRRAWAQAVFNTGDYERAASILEPALVAGADNPEVLLLHANILSKQGKEDEARAVFEQARSLKAAQLGVPVPEGEPEEPLDPIGPFQGQP